LIIVASRVISATMMLYIECGSVSGPFDNLIPRFLPYAARAWVSALKQANHHPVYVNARSQAVCVGYSEQQRGMVAVVARQPKPGAESLRSPAQKYADIF
jgi:hypothetical protein